MNVYDKLRNHCLSFDTDCCYQIWEKNLGHFGKFNSIYVVMPWEEQQIIGKLLFSHSKDNDYFGFKAGSYSTIQAFSVSFADNCDELILHFYLPLKCNWEEYIFLLNKDGEITKAKIPTHIEERVIPSYNIILDCIEKSLA